jgi:hypothetical protein
VRRRSYLVVAQRLGGHTRARARPMSVLVGTAPNDRESCEFARLSPRTKKLPWRTVTGPK